MQNVTTWKEKIFVSEMNDWLKCRLEDVHSEFDYSMDAALFLTTIKAILDTGNKIQTPNQLRIEKPYIALNDETYIPILPQELNNCKRSGYKYFCEELFVVKSRHRYSCASAVYFDSIHDIKENCDFYYYTIYNRTDITPSVLDG